MSKRSDLFNLCGSSCKSGEDSTDISTLLHRNNSKLIFLIDPDQECLFVVVENSSTSWPVSVKATCIKETITFFEEEMISNELLLLLRGHGSKRIEGTSKFSLEAIASLDNLLLDLISLFFRNSWSKRIFSQVTAYSNAS